MTRNKEMLEIEVNGSGHVFGVSQKIQIQKGKREQANREVQSILMSVIVGLLCCRLAVHLKDLTEPHCYTVLIQLCLSFLVNPRSKSHILAKPNICTSLVININL